MDILLFTLAGFAAALALIWIKTRMWDFPAQTPQDYAKSGPQIDIRQHLNGPIQCEGVIYGPTGRVTSSFTADFHAEWQGNTGRMTEHFRYNTGTQQNREWTLTLGNDGRIKAEAPDLLGQGTGKQLGSAVQLQYKIKLPESSGGHTLDTTDWMYLTENGVIMNRSQFRKFGIKVAELVAVMRPAGQVAQAAE